MNTVTCTTPEGKTRYYLADASGSPVPEVMDYLKFLDNQGKARNTLRLSCYQLQNYYRFLEEAEKDYRDVTIDDIARFMAWLRNPDLLKKVVPLMPEPARKEQTINENIDTIVRFYDYLARRGGLENRLSETLVKFVTHPNRSYKIFLYGIAENRPSGAAS
jgi:site-specific recombinase XerD